MAKWTIVCLLVVLALGGCGSGEAAEVRTAVEAVEAKLRSFYSHSYAGLDVEGDRLVIHRKPDAALDAVVRDLAEDVDVEFRDAPYALDELQPLADRVNADRHFWSTRKFPVALALPGVDGTGVNAFVATDDLEGARAEFRQRYGDEPIVVKRSARTGIVPVG